MVHRRCARAPRSQLPRAHITAAGARGGARTYTNGSAGDGCQPQLGPRPFPVLRARRAADAGGACRRTSTRAQRAGWERVLVGAPSLARRLTGMARRRQERALSMVGSLVVLSMKPRRPPVMRFPTRVRSVCLSPLIRHLFRTLIQKYTLSIRVYDAIAFNTAHVYRGLTKTSQPPSKHAMMIARVAAFCAIVSAARPLRVPPTRPRPHDHVAAPCRLVAGGTGAARRPRVSEPSCYGGWGRCEGPRGCGRCVRARGGKVPALAGACT